MMLDTPTPAAASLQSGEAALEIAIDKLIAPGGDAAAKIGAFIAEMARKPQASKSLASEAGASALDAIEN